MKKGFTLVELSLVLVIIGLIVGGILVAQSMIASSKILLEVRQIEQFDAAVNNFMTKYNSIPGDSKAMGCTTPLCGNGEVDDTFRVLGHPRPWYFDEEVANFWVHLGQSGFMQDGASFTAVVPASGFDISSNLRNGPAAPIGIGTGVIAATTDLTPLGYLTYYTTIYQLANHTAVNSSTNSGSIQANDIASITAADALALDQKIDDGLPSSGTVYVTDVNDGANSSYYFGQKDESICEDATQSYYNVSVAGLNCALDIQVLAKSGGIGH